MAMLLLLLLVTASLATTTTTIQAYDIYPLRLQPPREATSGNLLASVDCLSWRLAVESNNIIDWEKVPWGCSGYLRTYLLGSTSQYRNDSKVVIDEALQYVATVPLPRDGRNLWVFDIDETLLSNVPYFNKHGFGSKPLNSQLFLEWVLTAKGSALAGSQELYNKVLSLGIKVVFLTGRTEEVRAATTSNLYSAGYHTWEKLVLKSDEFANKTAQEYKSTIRASLEKEGYRIIGNIGDQWSDILGPSAGRRVFKLPNPMYYIA